MVFRWFVFIVIWFLITAYYTIYIGYTHLDVSNTPVNTVYILITFISKCGFILATIVWYITLLNCSSVKLTDNIYMLFNISISRLKYPLQLALFIFINCNSYYIFKFIICSYAW